MIVILSGTNRQGSNTRKVAGLVEQLHATAGAPTRLLDLTELPAECFTPAAYGEKPAGFRPFNDAVLAATGLVVVTPEYNGSFPGVLKYFIDLLEFPAAFDRRPVSFVGLAAGMWGAIRSVEQLQHIFGYRNAHVYPDRVFLPGIGGKFDAEGAFNDAEARTRLERQAAGFRDFAARLTGK
ncbi:MAG: NAD(P)H-dependent oxidoreductase [Verrucomicrobia bacterium]|nr:NAD(P)H-dependent oxidoreductase [Verrucomicrobiota bacterium]